MPTVVRARRGAIESLRETVFGLALASLDHAGVPYDVRFRPAGLATALAARDHGRGVMLVGVHSQTMPLVPRLLHDARVHPHYVGMHEAIYIAGTRHRHPTMQPGPALLLTVAAALGDNGIVWAVIDTPDRIPGRTVDIDVHGATLHIATPLLHVASRSGAAAFIFTSRVTGRGVVEVSFAPAGSGADVLDATLVRLEHELSRYARGAPAP